MGLSEALEAASLEFDKMCRERWEMGAQQYGATSFLNPDVDTLQMALEEITDLSNYARMTFMKLRMIQSVLANEANNEERSTQAQRDGFIPAGDVLSLFDLGPEGEAFKEVRNDG
jgi:hypothetical protein